MITNYLAVSRINDFCKKNNGRDFDPKITYSQIKNENPIHYFSWGVSELFTFDYHGIALKVNGAKFQNWVAITLNFSDLYDIHLFDENGEFISTHSDYYFDQLNPKIDSLIESGD